MDVKMISPFVDAFINVLPQLGIQNVTKGKLSLKEKLVSSLNVTGIIGLSKNVRGNVAYSMSEETAKNIASKMMMGMPVEEFDDMAQSAIAELTNMVTADAAMVFESQGFSIQISPPTLIIGDNITVMVSPVQTLVIEIMTEAGLIEANIGLEV